MHKYYVLLTGSRWAKVSIFVVMSSDVLVSSDDLLTPFRDRRRKGRGFDPSCHYTTTSLLSAPSPTLPPSLLPPFHRRTAPPMTPATRRLSTRTKPTVRAASPSQAPTSRAQISPGPTRPGHPHRPILPARPEGSGRGRRAGSAGPGRRRGRQACRRCRAGR
jgi:hypothetical protein